MLSSTKNSVGSPLSQMRAKALLRKKIKALIPMAIGLVLAALTVSGWAEVDVLVGRFDSRGTGANLRETILNTRNVNPSDFGKLFSYEVEGFVYTQPLIVSGMGVRGRQRNVLYVATTNSMVYAVDADDPGPDGGLLWQVRLTDQGAFPAPPHRGSLTIQSNAGILSTPVIDRPRSAIYVVARSLGPTGYVQRLHALDLFTGREKSGSPVEISASVHESGDGLTFTFNPEMQMNRPGLALSGSSVVIAWSPLDADDVDHGHGWVMAYDAGTLHRTGVF